MNTTDRSGRFRRPFRQTAFAVERTLGDDRHSGSRGRCRSPRRRPQVAAALGSGSPGTSSSDADKAGGRTDRAPPGLARTTPRSASRRRGGDRADRSGTVRADRRHRRGTLAGRRATRPRSPPRGAPASDACRASSRASSSICADISRVDSIVASASVVASPRIRSASDLRLGDGRVGGPSVRVAASARSSPLRTGWSCDRTTGLDRRLRLGSTTSRSGGGGGGAVARVARRRHLLQTRNRCTRTCLHGRRLLTGCLEGLGDLGEELVDLAGVISLADRSEGRLGDLGG